MKWYIQRAISEVVHLPYHHIYIEGFVRGVI